MESPISSTICVTGTVTTCSSFPNIPIHTKFQQLKHRLCVTTLYSSWIHSMKSLHGSAQIALHWTEGLPVRPRGWLNSRISPCLLQSTCCVWVNSRIPLVCSSCACSRDSVSVWMIWCSVTSQSTKFINFFWEKLTSQNCHQTWIHLTLITLAKNCVILRTPPWGLGHFDLISHFLSVFSFLLHCCSLTFLTLYLHFFVQYQASLNPIIAQPLLCASDVWHFVIRSALFSFALMNARFLNFLSTTSLTHMYFSITCFIQPSPLMDAHAFADWRHGSWESLHDPVLAKDVSSPFLQQLQLSGRIILLQKNSNLLFCCVLGRAVSVFIPPLHNSATCTFARCSLSCPIAVWISIRLLHLVPLSSMSPFASDSSRHSRLDTWSFLLFPSHCTWRLLVLGTCTTIFPQLFCTEWLSASSLHSESSRVLLLPNQEHLSLFGCASTEYPRAVRSITLPKKQIMSPVFSILHVILIKTCFNKSSTSFRTSFFGPNIKPSSTWTKIFVHLIVSETTWVRQEWVIVQTFQDNHEVLMPQFWCFAISVQNFVQCPHFIWFLAVLQTRLDQHPREGMLCVRQSKLWCGLTPRHCLCRVSSQPTSFSQTTLTVLVKTSRAEYVPGLQSFKTNLDFTRFSHDLLIVFESFSCQLLETFLQLSSHHSLNVHRRSWSALHFSYLFSSSNLRFTGSSGSGTNVIGWWLRHSAVSGSGSVSPPFHDPRRLACRVFLRSHPHSRSLLRSDFLLFMHFWYHTGICCSICCHRPWLLRGRRLLWVILFWPTVLCKSSYTSLIHYSIICSDKVFVCEVALFPVTRWFPSVCQLWCWISRSFSALEDVQELFLQTPPIFHDRVLPWHGRMETVSHYLGNEE